VSPAVPTDFLELADKTVLVCGVANKKSVAYHVGTRLQAAGAEVVWSVHTEARRAQLSAHLQGPIHVCDVSRPEEIERLRSELAAAHSRLSGLVHSLAFADYSGGWKPFHETPRAAFLEAVQVSCFSLVELANALKELLDADASVVALSISSTRTAAENYGYMAPVKAALDSSLVFLAKSFARFSRVRFNAVQAGPLKTSSSAGIPGYVESYLHAERLTLRGRGLETREVADAVLFLLSPRSSGINASGIVVDAGMGVNSFDERVLGRAAPEEGQP
jgi:enoyl-[acyl-carrier protein] reductase I